MQVKYCIVYHKSSHKTIISFNKDHLTFQLSNPTKNSRGKSLIGLKINNISDEKFKIISYILYRIKLLAKFVRWWSLKLSLKVETKL